MQPCQGPRAAGGGGGSRGFLQLSACSRPAWPRQGTAANLAAAPDLGSNRRRGWGSSLLRDAPGQGRGARGAGSRRQQPRGSRERRTMRGGCLGGAEGGFAEPIWSALPAASRPSPSGEAGLRAAAQPVASQPLRERERGERAPARPCGCNFQPRLPGERHFWWLLEGQGLLLFKGVWLSWTAFEQVGRLMWGSPHPDPSPAKHPTHNRRFFLNELKWMNGLDFIMWLPFLRGRFVF